MTVRVRFAPSPTGMLHIGNARAALTNWLFAHRHGGSFMLRIDDTDLQRSEERFTQAIIQDLEWLGLTHDRFVKQSDRFDRYAEAMQQLIGNGRLYPCYETPEELEFKRKRQLARGIELCRIAREQRQGCFPRAPIERVVEIGAPFQEQRPGIVRLRHGKGCTARDRIEESAQLLRQQRLSRHAGR